MTALPRVGPYLLHRRIAKGGMAEVYLASAEGVGGSVDLVALKCIRPEFADDPSFSRMFLDEARITAGLRHPNITRLLDFGEDGGRPFLVMEFVAGASLKQILKAGPVPPGLAVEIATGVAAALHAAHEQVDESGQLLGIIHRDVTPQNVMISFGGEVKLLDFGIALARVRAERTRTGVLKGKWAYMSPEQVQGRKLDRRSDVFSLGALVHEMVTAQRAFDGDSPSEVLGGVMLRHPTRLTELVAGVPEGLARVVERCLAKGREERFQTADEVARALAAVGQELRATRIGEDLGAFVRRSLPDLVQQVTSTRVEVEAAAASAVEEPLDGPTVVQPAPFEQVAADLEGSDSGEKDDPAAREGSSTLRDLAALRATDADADEDEHEDDEPPPGSFALRVALTVAVGVAVGVGLAVLVWALGAG